MTGPTPGPEYMIGYDPPRHGEVGCATWMLPSGVVVGTLRVYDKAFGDDLARRWNAHTDLLAACEQVVREVECHCADYPRSPVGSCPACVCRAAVAKGGA